MTPNLTRTLMWPAFALLACLSVWGFYSGHLFQQSLWTPIGKQRLGEFTLLFSGWSTLALIWFPRWFARLTVLILLAFTAAAAGPLAPLAVAALLFSSFVLGSLCLRRETRAEGQAALTGDLLALALGIAVYSLAVGFAAHFAVNYPITWLLALAVPLVIRPRRTVECARRCLGLFRDPPPASWPESCALALLLYLLAAHWLVALKPEVSADGLAMHLVVPASVANHHYWAFDAAHTVWAVMPMGADWCYALAYILGGETAARLVNFAAFVLILAMLYRALRPWAAPGLSLLMLSLLASSPIVQLETGSLFVENIWTVFLFGAFLALWQFRETGVSRWLYLTGALLGAGMATKFGALPFSVLLGAFLAAAVWKNRQRLRPRPAVAVLLALACFLFFAAPPYVNAWVRTGNPVFPFMNAVFKSPYYDSSSSITDPRYRTPLSFQTLYNVTFRNSKYLESQDGGWGFQFLLFLPLSLLVVHRDWPWLCRAALVVSVLFSVLTFHFQSYLRYVYPALPLFTMLIALLFERVRALDRGLHATLLAAAVTVIALNVWFLPASGWYHNDFYLNVFDRGDIDRYLQVSAPVRKLVDYVNRRYPYEPVMFFDTNQIAGLHGTAYTTSWHNEAFRHEVSESFSAKDLVRLAGRHNVRLFVAPCSEYRASILYLTVPPFLDGFTEVEMRNGRFCLTRMRDEYAGARANETLRLLDRGLVPSPPGDYDDNSPRIVYEGPWLHDSQFTNAARGSLTYAGTSGASFLFTFRGSAITWVYTRAKNRGIAAVEIDGEARETVDLYSADTLWQSSTSYAGLKNGDHRFKVTVLRQKNPKSEGYFVDLDLLRTSANQ